MSISKRGVLLPVLAVFASSAVTAESSDPMKPPAHLISNVASEHVAAGSIELQMILISKNRKVAVINDKMMREGDVKNGITLISINKHKVSVKRQGKVIDLKLKSVKTKKGLAK
ncbi:hypothetical protein A9Q99_12175 [Gammaproteobacteria bacterium 45_16_T64]|nr:hypothetical protein A9Q99_12175 [Gammaproteobacteria bacterium 45_16_T64]